jgi:hypothetical protein
MSRDTIRYQRSHDVLFRHVRDLVLLLDPSDGQVVALGGAGPDLWELLAHPITFRDAVSRLASSYAVAPERIEPEVRVVFDHLARRDVLVAAAS